MSAERYLLIIYLVLINVMSMFMFAIDKLRSKKRKWRISEFALLVSAGLGGALGAWISMNLFHHKTRHTKFRIMVPLFLVLWTCICVYLIVFVKV